MEALLALGAIAALCVLALNFTPYVAEPDDYAYHASIVAMTQGHFLSLINVYANGYPDQAEVVSANSVRPDGGASYFGYQSLTLAGSPRTPKNACRPMSLTRP